MSSNNKAIVPIVKSSILENLQQSKLIRTHDLVEIYLQKVPSMRKRKSEALKKVSQIVFDLDIDQQLKADFDWDGDVLYASSKNN